MYIHDVTYDIDELARQNLHVHTSFSKCAKPEMTVENIVRAAEVSHLDVIALVDHYNTDNSDKQCVERYEILRQQYRELNTPVMVLFGNELSEYAIGKSLESEKTRSRLEYRLYSCNHYHLDYWEHPEDKSPRGYAEHAYKVVSTLIRSGKADCIAHPLIGGYIRGLNNPNSVAAALTDNELGDLLTLGKEYLTAFEFNYGAVLGNPDFALRMWNMGKEIGTCFNFGMDAHKIVEVDTFPLAEKMKELTKG